MLLRVPAMNEETESEHESMFGFFQKKALLWKKKQLFEINNVPTKLIYILAQAPYLLLDQETFHKYSNLFWGPHFP